MGGKNYFKDSYTERPLRAFDFKLYLEGLGFKPSKLDNLRFYRGDGFNLRIVPGEIRTAELFNSNKTKPHVANFIIPNGFEEAQVLFKSFKVINSH